VLHELLSAEPLSLEICGCSVLQELSEELLFLESCGCSEPAGLGKTVLQALREEPFSLQISGCSESAGLGNPSSKPGGGGMTMSRPGGLRKGVFITARDVGGMMVDGMVDGMVFIPHRTGLSTGWPGEWGWRFSLALLEAGANTA
jgi:hypothetical protein